MSYIEFYTTLGVFAGGIILLGLLLWARVRERLAAHKAYIKRLIRANVRHKGDVIPFEDIIHEEDIWIVTGDHPQLGRPDLGGLNDEEAKEYARGLLSAGYENVRFIKQN